MARSRPILVAVRLTPDESADWRTKAKAAGVPLSVLIRRAMARTRTWTVSAANVERERNRQVSRIGNNLNQIARWANNDKLDSLAQAVLDARVEFHDATLADLYEPDLMPPSLRRAHRALDRAVDRLYHRTGFTSERERAEHLFMLDEKMRAPLGIGIKKPKRRRR